MVRGAGTGNAPRIWRSKPLFSLRMLRFHSFIWSLGLLSSFELKRNMVPGEARQPRRQMEVAGVHRSRGNVTTGRGRCQAQRSTRPQPTRTAPRTRSSNQPHPVWMEHSCSLRSGLVGHFKLDGRGAAVLGSGCTENAAGSGREGSPFRACATRGACPLSVTSLPQCSSLDVRT